MRSKMKNNRKCAILLLLLVGAAFAQAPHEPQGNQAARLAEALQLYRTGQFDAAAAKYKAILQSQPANGDAHAGLVRVYLKQEDVRRASDEALAGLRADPLCPALQTALGEVYFRQGRIEEAEQQFVKVLNTGAGDARAYLGVARVREAVSMYGLAKDAIETAHKLDPSDPDIQRWWIDTLTLSQRIEALERYLAGPTGDDAESRQQMQRYLELLKDMQKHPERRCTLLSTASSSEIPLVPVVINRRVVRGFGLNVKVNGQDAGVVLDTGATGIVISKKLGDKAGITALLPTKIGGIGDEEATRGYWGYADSIRIGDLEFRNCLVRVAAGRLGAADGLIGTDLFSRYLVSVDFPHQKMRLTELPQRPGKNHSTATLDTGSGGVADSAGEPQDRYIAPEMRSYTRVFRFGHHLLMPMRIGDAPPKLFLIDTGSMQNHVSPEAAREVTRVHEDPGTRAGGLSGSVDKVYSADKVVLQFSHFRQENQELIAVDLSQLSRGDGTEVSGILGFATLWRFEIKIDYRDGLVDFVLDRKQVRR